MEGKKEKQDRKTGCTRRDFIKTSLAGAAGLLAGSTIGPTIVRAQQKPIRIASMGANSGAVGMAGESSFRGIMLWVNQVNSRGGLLGRKVEAITRDTLGKPEECARYARDYAASDYDFIYAYGSSAEAFAVNAISRDLKKVIFVCVETTEFTANPKIRSPYCFRPSRNQVLDNIVSAKYAAQKAKAIGLTRWYTLAEDYAYGRDAVGMFLEFFKRYHPKAEIVGQGWPKLGEPDFTSHITAMMNAKPQAVFAALFAGDAIGFVRQAAMYGAFDKIDFFMKDLTDYTVLEPIVQTVGKLPRMYAGTEYLRVFPDTAENHAFCDSYQKAYGGARPLLWSWKTYTGCLLIEEAVKKAKTTDTEAVMKALRDLTVKSPVGMGKNGTVTMRGRDGQLIYYPVAWGPTLPNDPFMTDIVPGNWDEMLAEETSWLESKGWL
jgi:branched-chain amino acid transport system substrate-binding protein